MAAVDSRKDRSGRDRPLAPSPPRRSHRKPFCVSPGGRPHTLTPPSVSVVGVSVVARRGFSSGSRTIAGAHERAARRRLHLLFCLQERFHRERVKELSPPMVQFETIGQFLPVQGNCINSSRLSCQRSVGHEEPGSVAPSSRGESAPSVSASRLTAHWKTAFPPQSLPRRDLCMILRSAHETKIYVRSGKTCRSTINAGQT